MNEKGLEYLNNAVEKKEEEMEKIAIDQYGQYPEIINELERQLEFLEAQIDSVKDDDLAVKINSELPLLRDELEAWNDITGGDLESLEINEV